MDDNQHIPLRWWVLPGVFYFIHLVAVHAFASGNAPLTGPDADAGSMAWIAWYLIDFPIGILAVSLGEEFESNTAAVWTVALIGGIQWLIWGWILTAIIRRFQLRSAK